MGSGTVEICTLGTQLSLLKYTHYVLWQSELSDYTNNVFSLNSFLVGATFVRVYYILLL
jgi:hypothetical protein